MVKADPPGPPFKAPSDVSGWIAVIAIGALSIALSFLVGEARGWVIGGSIGAFGLLIQMSQTLRKEAWFWASLAPLALLHVWAVGHFDWSWVERGRGFTVLGQYVTGDFLIMMAMIYGIYRFKFGKPAEAVEPSIDDLPRYNDRDIEI